MGISKLLFRISLIWEKSDVFEVYLQVLIHVVFAIDPG